MYSRKLPMLNYVLPTPRQKLLRFYVTSYVTCTLHLSKFDICANTRIRILPLGHVIADWN